MRNKEAIIELIKENIRLNQYIAALRKLGIEVCDPQPDLMSIVAQLMEIPRAHIAGAWMDLYAQGIYKGENLPIEPTGNNLYPIARDCYETLRKFEG